jgi:hypothetical protein
VTPQTAVEARPAFTECVPAAASHRSPGRGASNGASALAVLVGSSQGSNVKLHEVARRLVIPVQRRRSSSPPASAVGP